MFLFLLSTIAAQLANSLKCSGESICMEFDGSCFNFYCASTGWCAVGVSANGVMNGLDIFWFSEMGMLNLQGSGRFQPRVKSVLTTVTPLIDNSPSWSKLTQSFCPDDSQNATLNSNNKFVYAISNTKPVGSNLETISFQRHDAYGALVTVQGSAAGSTSGSRPEAESATTTVTVTPSSPSQPQNFATRSNSLIAIWILALTNF